MTILFVAIALGAAATAQASSISGTVTAGGVGVPDVQVYAENISDWNSYGYGYTAVNGVYTIGGLATGTYKVEFRDWNGTYLTQFYNNKSSFDTADAVSVTAPNPTTGIDAALVVGGTISGTVTAGGAGVPNVYVTVYASSAYGYGSVGYGQTNADGAYSVGGLSTGSYKVQFEDSNRFYAGEWYNDALSWDDATFVPVTQGSDTPDIGVTLAAGGTISGVVHAPGMAPSGNEYVVIDAWLRPAAPGECWNRVWLGSADITADGQSYVISGLPAGQVFLSIEAYGNNDFATPQWWNGAYNCNEATAITVAAGTEYTGKDFTLAAPVAVSGTVRDGSGQPVAGAWINAKFDACGDDWSSFAGSAHAAADGTYTITGLPPTNLYFMADSGQYKIEYWDGATGTTNCSLATALDLGAGAPPAVDFSLVPRPLPPGMLSVDTGAGGAVLVWEPSPTPGVSGYNVSRWSYSTYEFTQLGTTAGLSYADTGAAQGEMYYYSVRAYDVDSESWAAYSVVTVGAPRPPAPLSGTSGVGQVEITWGANHETDIDHYKVYRSVAVATGFTQISRNPGWPADYVFIGESVDTTHTDSSLETTGQSYRYRVTAVDNQLAGLESNPSMGIIIAANGLQAPTGLFATPASGQVVLDWSDVGAPLDHYVVYRATGGAANFDLIGTSGVSNYTDTGVVDGTMYFYLVGAMDADGLLSLNGSLWASATPGGPAVPTGLTAGLSGGAVVLDWSDNSPAVDNYRVYRSVSSGSGYTRLGAPTVSTYTDTLADPDNVYYYRVTSVAGSSASGFSVEAVYVPSTGNEAPTLAALSPLTISEDAGQQTVNLSGISAGSGESQTLIVTAGSSNIALIPNPTVTYSSPSATGSLLFTPVANASGTSTITVTVNDGQPVNNTTVRTFLVTVNAVNDAPRFTKGVNQTVLEDAGAQTVAGWATAISAGPADEAAQALDFMVTNDNTGLFAVQPAIGATGALTYTPALNANGSALVTVRIHDNGSTANGGVDTSAPQTFTITVTAVNDAPVLGAVGNKTVDEAQTLAFTLTATDVDQNGLTYSSTALPAGATLNAATGAFSWRPGYDQAGNYPITFKVTDNGTPNLNDTETITIAVVNVYFLPTSWVGSVSITADRNVVAVGRPHIGSEVASYNGFPAGALSAYLPMLFKDAFGGSYDSAFYVQNVQEFDSANLVIKYYNSAGSLNCTVNDSVAPLASKGYWLPSQTCLPAGWVGGVVITSDQPIVAIGRAHIGAEVMTYAGFSSGSLTSSLPMLFKDAFGGSYDSAFYVQNVDDTDTANLTIDFYDNVGNLSCTKSDTVARLASKGYWLPGEPCLPTGWVGGVVVTSDRPVVTVGRPHIGAQITTYNGFSSGAALSSLPMLFKDAFGGSYDAAFYVQNVDDTDTANLTIDFYDNAGNLSCTKNDTVARLASKGYWLPGEPCLPTGWVGGGVVTSDRPVVTVGRLHIGTQITTYDGFTSGSMSAYLPMLFSAAFGGSYNSAFYIQNTETSAAAVTTNFYDSSGALTCSRNDTIPALSTLGLWLPSLTCFQ